MHRRLEAIITLLALGTIACGGGMNLRLVNSAADKPSNVWVFFSVKKGDEPVGWLTADSFTIYEDDKEVSKFESKQVILNPEVAAAMYTLLLVDMSGSITEAGETDTLVDAAKTFSERVGKSQKVGIYAFDGSEKLHSVTPFTESSGSVHGGLEGLRRFKPKDPSTNLHGAIVEGLRTLREALDREKKPLKFGTLVVFTDGTDQAARVSEKDMLREIHAEPYEEFQIYAIGVGAELERSQLGKIGKDGTEMATDRGKIQQAFDRIAGRVEAHTKSFYLLSYCTPARAGSHHVRIVASREVDGKTDRGNLEYGFTADGFEPRCDPSRKPSFKLEGTADGKPASPAGASINVKGSVR